MRTMKMPRVNYAIPVRSKTHHSHTAMPARAGETPLQGWLSAVQLNSSAPNKKAIIFMAVLLWFGGIWTRFHAKPT